VRCTGTVYCKVAELLTHLWFPGKLKKYTHSDWWRKLSPFRIRKSNKESRRLNGILKQPKVAMARSPYSVQTTTPAMNFTSAQLVKALQCPAGWKAVQERRRRGVDLGLFLQPAEDRWNWVARAATFQHYDVRQLAATQPRKNTTTSDDEKIMSKHEQQMVKRKAMEWTSTTRLYHQRA